MGDFSVDSLASGLCEKYDVPADVARADVAHIVDKWREIEVVE